MISSQRSFCPSKPASFRPPLASPGNISRLATSRRPAPARIQAEASTVGYPTPPSVEDQLGDKYAVIEVGGLQQIVEEGHWYTCNRLKIPPGSVVNFPRVLARKKDGDLEIGQPFLEDVTVEAEILEELRGPKLVIAKFKRKKHYKRRMGHRQELTRFRITSIS